MKLQIKTLNQKTLVIDIEETKTVYDLKKELSLYPDVGVQPELQKLIYAGKILSNEDKLSSYSIDVKKCLVIMILKQPLEPPAKAPQPDQEKPKTEADNVSGKETENKTAGETESKTAEVLTNVTEKVDDSGPTSTSKDSMVSRIVSMGYPESEVRKALTASFYNAERAIEYLIEGIPAEGAPIESESFSDADVSIEPLEVFRGDPIFRNLRRVLQQNPEVLNAAIDRIATTNPSLLNLINEYQQDFLNVLTAETDTEDDDDDDDMETGGSRQ